MSCAGLQQKGQRISWKCVSLFAETLACIGETTRHASFQLSPLSPAREENRLLILRRANPVSLHSALIQARHTIRKTPFCNYKKDPERDDPWTRTHTRENFL
ncbi:unnamed protein product [Gadus morhua 'NCC']